MKKYIFLPLLLLLGFVSQSSNNKDSHPSKQKASIENQELMPTGFAFDWRQGIWNSSVSEDFISVFLNGGMVLKDQQKINPFTVGGKIAYQHKIPCGFAYGASVGFNFMPGADNGLNIEDNTYNHLGVLPVVLNATMYLFPKSFVHPYVGVDAGVNLLFGKREGLWRGQIWQHPDFRKMKFAGVSPHVAPHLGCMIEVGPSWRFLIDASVVYLPNETFSDTYYWYVGRLRYEEPININTGIFIAPILSLGLSYSF